MKIKTVIAIVIIAVIVVVCILADRNKRRQTEEIKSNIRVTEGAIFQVSVTNYKGPKTMYITYNYKVNGLEKEGEKSVNLGKGYRWSREELLYTRFPVVYSAKDPANCDILIVHEDSVTYGLAQ